MLTSAGLFYTFLRKDAPKKRTLFERDSFNVAFVMPIFFPNCVPRIRTAREAYFQHPSERAQRDSFISRPKLVGKRKSQR